MSRLAIGTVQFGLDYGISNIHGKTDAEEVGKILAFARQEGHLMLDTAQKYGEAEKVLGDINTEGFDIVSKLCPPLDLQNSLDLLKTKKIYGLLFHNANHLLADYSLWDTFLAYKESGLVEKIGVSVYTVEEAQAVIDNFDIDLIQPPCSILDQRMVRSGMFKKLKDKGVEIHVRSVLLQGLLLMSQARRPAYFDTYNDVFARFSELQKANSDITPLEIALEYVLQLDEVDKVVCGVNNLQQFEEIVKIYKKHQNNEYSIDFSNFYSTDDANLLDPSKWKVHDENRDNWAK